jgi:hypothetical protein
MSVVKSRVHGGLRLDCKLLGFVYVSYFFCGSLGFFFSSDVFYLRSFFHDHEDDDPLECLNALVFRVLLCVSFLLSKWSFLDPLSVMLCSKGLG